jgi:YVTN family beta-propeller protein
VGGLSVSPDGKRLYAVNVLGQSLTSVDLEAGKPVQSVALEAEPYTCLAAPDGLALFVSLWGGAKVLVFDASTLERTGEITVGEHPNAMAVSADGGRLFVACANTNAVWAVDLSAGRAIEQISTALFPGLPPGSTPNGLGLSPDGRRLLVANADNNAVGVVDVAERGNSRVVGFLPTGWYPTAVGFSRDGKTIRVLSGKGLVSQANPRGPQPGIPAGEPGQYIGALLTGSLSVVSAPDAAALARYTKTVYELTPRFETTPPRAARDAGRSSAPIPFRPGGRSPIRHVFYVLRENRTYDQILGDLGEGNGDASLCLFGEDVTPNAHALAREFVLLDNFYVNSEVSYNGHEFSDGAYASDVAQKLWPMNYADRGGAYLSGEGGPMRNPYGNLVAPASGYIWDACRRSGVSFRDYGEFIHEREGSGEEAGAAEAKPTAGNVYEAGVPGLEGHFAPKYPGFDVAIPDARRFEVWLEEFRQFERDGGLPALSIVYLPSDHTAGAKPGFRTPRAMIADNDLALGRLVETVSKSRYWKESAIFVLEDDAQNGPDHVDAHRSVALVASPYARRGAVDSTLYTTCGMLRTIELVLGLSPMSQCDAAAAPMRGAFRSVPDPTPFIARAARVSLDETNGAAAWGAAESAQMNLAEADRAPDLELNEIVWRSVRGADCPMPPPVRAAFVRPAASAGDDD